MTPGILGGITVVYNATNVDFVGNFYLGNIVGMDISGDFSSRFATVSVGATSITVDDGSKFSVLQWIALTNGDLQAEGNPINPVVFEYAKITGIAGNVLTFVRANSIRL